MSTNKDLITEYKNRSKIGNFWLIGQLAEEFGISKAAVYRKLADAESKGFLVENIFED